MGRKRTSPQPATDTSQCITTAAGLNAGGRDAPNRLRPLLISEDEAAAFLSMGARTLQRLRLEGEGPPYVKLTERRIAYPVSTLEAWAMARLATSTSAA
jgi:hypothetical protein